MPTVLEIPFVNEVPSAMEPVHLPALFIKYLAAADPECTALLQQALPPRPYTLSTFYRRHSQWQWRVTLLQDTLADPFLAGLTKGQSAEEEGSCSPIDTSNIVRRDVSYEMLLEEASPQTGLRLRFLSPTSFHSGAMTYPLPDPVGIVQSWWERWNAFSPVKVDRVLLDVAAVHLAVSRCSIHTRQVELGVGRAVGFVGSTTLQAVHAYKVGDDVLRQLNALARFAAFCGTGQRTAQGMGQTRYYPHDGATS